MVFHYQAAKRQKRKLWRQTGWKPDSTTLRI